MIVPIRSRRSSRVAVVYGAVAADAAPDEQDVLVEVSTVQQRLSALGFSPVVVPLTLDLEAVRQRLLHLRPAFVFNLVESVEGLGRLIHLAPALYESLGLPYTGAGSQAMYLTSNKPLAKRLMASRESLSMKNTAPTATPTEAPSRTCVARPMACAAMAAITSA